MKSDSDSAPRRAKWARNRTLRRKPDFRLFSDDDLKFAWAAYRKGALSEISERFEDGGLTPVAFKDAFGEVVVSNYDFGWMLLAPDPVGLVFAMQSHKNAEKSPFLVVGDIVWFPWSSPRQRIESAVNFFNEARKEIAFMEYARKQDKRFFEMIAKHGIMRRVGTSHNIYPDGPATVFETRKWH